MTGGSTCRYGLGVAGRKSEAVKAAQARLRQRVEGQLLVVEAFVRADEQVEAAQDRLKAVLAENEARVTAAEGDIGQAKRARAEMLAGLAAMVNDEDEAAVLVEVSVAEVRAAKRAVPVERAREAAAQASRRPTSPAANGARKPAAPAKTK